MISQSRLSEVSAQRAIGMISDLLFSSVENGGRVLCGYNFLRSLKVVEAGPDLRYQQLVGRFKRNNLIYAPTDTSGLCH